MKKVKERNKGLRWMMSKEKKGKKKELERKCLRKRYENFIEQI